MPKPSAHFRSEHATSMAQRQDGPTAVSARPQLQKGTSCTSAEVESDRRRYIAHTYIVNWSSGRGLSRGRGLHRSQPLFVEQGAEPPHTHASHAGSQGPAQKSQGDAFVQLLTVIQEEQSFEYGRAECLLAAPSVCICDQSPIHGLCLGASCI